MQDLAAGEAVKIIEFGTIRARIDAVKNQSLNLKMQFS